MKSININFGEDLNKYIENLNHGEEINEIKISLKNLFEISLAQLQTLKSKEIPVNFEIEERRTIGNETNNKVPQYTKINIDDLILVKQKLDKVLVTKDDNSYEINECIKQLYKNCNISIINGQVCLNFNNSVERPDLKINNLPRTYETWLVDEDFYLEKVPINIIKGLKKIDLPISFEVFVKDEKGKTIDSKLVDIDEYINILQMIQNINQERFINCHDVFIEIINGNLEICIEDCIRMSLGKLQELVESNVPFTFKEVQEHFKNEIKSKDKWNQIITELEEYTKVDGMPSSIKSIADKIKIDVGNDAIDVEIDSANELSVEQANLLKKCSHDVYVQVYSPENDPEQNVYYTIDEYIAIRKKLDELVEGIDSNWPEEKRFMEVYKRVCSNIVYDIPAAYPKTESEIKYSEEVDDSCRNLLNGLLEGKCVCAGYADILRNALSMVGVEAKYIGGEIKETIISKTTEGHAWNKVKLNGVWYNVDSCWDADIVRAGLPPTECLKTDKQIKSGLLDIKFNFEGPECTTEVSEKEIDKIFGGNHKYIGNIQIPKWTDVKGWGRYIGKAYIEFFKKTKYIFIMPKEKLVKLFKPKVKTLPEGGKDNDNLEKETPRTKKSKPWDLNNWNQDTIGKTKETNNQLYEHYDEHDKEENER